MQALIDQKMRKDRLVMSISVIKKFIIPLKMRTPKNATEGAILSTRRAMMMAARLARPHALAKQKIGAFFRKISPLYIIKFLIIDLNLNVIRIQHKFRSHMSNKSRAKAHFNDRMDSAVADILTRETDYMAVNTYFEISPFLKLFSDQIKEILFKIIYNQQLFAYLKKRLEESIHGGKKKLSNLGEELRQSNMTTKQFFEMKYQERLNSIVQNNQIERAWRTVTYNSKKKDKEIQRGGLFKNKEEDLNSRNTVGYGNKGGAGGGLAGTNPKLSRQISMIIPPKPQQNPSVIEMSFYSLLYFKRSKDILASHELNCVILRAKEYTLSPALITLNGYNQVLQEKSKETRRRSSRRESLIKSSNSLVGLRRQESRGSILSTNSTNNLNALSGQGTNTILSRFLNKLSNPNKFEFKLTHHQACCLVLSFIENIKENKLLNKYC